VRLSTVIVGTGNVVVIIAPAQQGVEPLVAVRARKAPTYRAVYRLATRIFRLSNTYAAAGRKQYATIHHAATATKTVRLRSVKVTLDSAGVAVFCAVELVRITAAPATGNPAITPILADSGDPAVEATCLALPTTAGTEAAAPYSQREWNFGAATTATAAAAPVPPQPQVEMIEQSARDDEGKLPTIRAGVLEGWAVTVDANAAATVTGYVQIEFTEEAP
jgi:hypothetical protein